MAVRKEIDSFDITNIITEAIQNYPEEMSDPLSLAFEIQKRLIIAGYLIIEKAADGGTQGG